MKKLNSVNLAIPKGIFEKDKSHYDNPHAVIDDFLEIYSNLYKLFGNPSIKKGISLEELKKQQNIEVFELDQLPLLEWTLDSTKLTLRYIDHFGIAPEIKLHQL